jgi:hypothetical protein
MCTAVGCTTIPHGAVVVSNPKLMQLLSRKGRSCTETISEPARRRLFYEKDTWFYEKDTWFYEKDTYLYEKDTCLYEKRYVPLRKRYVSL